MTGDPTRPKRLVLAILLLGAASWFTHRTMTREMGMGTVVAGLATYTEYMASAWEEYGFARSLGVPMFLCIGETVLEREPYAHQAPAGWWWPSFGRWMFGKGALGYRFFPALFFGLATLLLAFLVTRLAGGLAGAGILAGILLCPVSSFYAALPGIESIAFLASTAFLLLWWRADEGRSRSGRGLLVLTFLLGTQCAWSFAFLAPGVFLAEFLRPREERRFRGPIGLMALQVVGVVLVLLHLAVGTRSFDRTFGEIFETALEVFTHGIRNQHEVLGAVSPVPFLEAQDRFSRENLGSLGRLLLLGSLVLVYSTRTGRKDPLARLAVPYLSMGILSVVVFNARSNTHGYYWTLMAPAFGLVLVAAIRTSRALLGPALGRFHAAPFLLAAAACIGLDFGPARKHSRQLTAPGLAEVAATIDSQVPEGDWICAFDANLTNAALYSQRRWTPPLLTPELIDKVLDARSQGRAKFGRLWVQIDDATIASIPELRLVKAHLDALAEQGRAQRSIAGAQTMYVL